MGAVLGEIETASASSRPESGPSRQRTASTVRPARSSTSRSPRWATPWPRAPCSSGASSRGDTVAVDDPLVEISTDKVDAELPSPVAGTIAELLVEPDETVAVGTVLCRIEAGAGAPKANGPVQPGRRGDRDQARREAQPAPATAT